jgi:CBS domain-containing protein
MTCAEVMTKDPACCAPDDTVARAAKLMKTEDVGSIPVCESRQSRKLVGIVTDRDLAVQVIAEGRNPNQTLVRDVMTKDPITCSTADDLDQVFDAMQSYQVRRIPIVDRNKELVGIISQADLAIHAEEPEKTAETLEEISRPAPARAA